METSAPGIYAAGDVTGTGYLTPVARHQGRKAADAILGNQFELIRSRSPRQSNCTMILPTAEDLVRSERDSLFLDRLVPGLSGKSVIIIPDLQPLRLIKTAI
jgi:hypothetical protein